jgi:hypothetical protein
VTKTETGRPSATGLSAADLSASLTGQRIVSASLTGQMIVSASARILTEEERSVTGRGRRATQAELALVLVVRYQPALVVLTYAMNAADSCCINHVMHPVPATQHGAGRPAREAGASWLAVSRHRTCW